MGVPSILAAAAVHSRLVAQAACVPSSRSSCARPKPWTPHTFALCWWVSAPRRSTPICRWKSFRNVLAGGHYPGMDEHKAFLNYKKAIEAGLMKILAKKGISVISSYRGGYEFEALGPVARPDRGIFPGRHLADLRHRAFGHRAKASGRTARRRLGNGASGGRASVASTSCAPPARPTITNRA